MRVLMVVPQYPFPIIGGLEKQAHELSVELARLGHEVSVLSGKIDRSQPGLEVMSGVAVQRVMWPRRRLVRWLVAPWLFIARFAVMARCADVVHVHVFSGVGLGVILLSRLLRRPVMVKLPNVGDAGIPGLRRAKLGAIRVRILKVADAIVAMSRQSVAELLDIGFEQNRIFSTPNGIALGRFAASRRRDTDRPCRFVFVGRLEPAKGLQLLVDAAEMVRGRHGPETFVVTAFGEGRLRSSIEQKVKERGLQEVISLAGNSDSIPETLSECDVFVLPSYQEGNSNAILEAMAAGLPIISARVGGTPMLVGQEGDHLLHEPGDLTGLVRRMETMLDDPLSRAAIGRAMRARVEAFFDIRGVAAGYATAYELLANRRRDRVSGVSNPVVLGAKDTACTTG